ncbi:GntR family transcriptional regulator [Actinomycetes bacterium KLBMP 9797]
MPIEVAPPKYVMVVNAIQQRIEDGTYPPGTAIPSESQLTAEFEASRPVIVRALGILQQDGWIESRQGKGRFVRPRAAAASRRIPEHIASLLEQTEDGAVSMLRVGPIMAPTRAAIALDLEPETPVIARRRLVVAEVGPVELATAYVPVELAAGTDVGKAEPITVGLLRHLTTVKGVQFDHATERISARLPSAEESELLKIARRDAVLTVLMTVFDLAGKPQLAVDAVLPANRHELEGSFPLR